jgi:hypothetical protein
MSPYSWELLYDHPTPKKVEYSRSILSYVDILGFRDLIETKTAGEISRLLRILAESVRPNRTFEPTEIKFTNFSDTVIRTMTCAEPGMAYLIYELKSLVYAQMALIPEGVTVRGAVTIGNVVQSWGVLYGPALIRAYELESAHGSPPRIVIDGEALNTINPAFDSRKFADDLAGLVKEDGETLFLDYLSACEHEMNVPEQEYPAFLELHRNFIRTNLKRFQDDTKKLPKYEWLKNYHDATIEEHLGDYVPRRLKV